MAEYVHAPFDVAVFSETEKGLLHGNGKKSYLRKKETKWGSISELTDFAERRTRT